MEIITTQGLGYVVTVVGLLLGVWHLIQFLRVRRALKAAEREHESLLEQIHTKGRESRGYDWTSETL